MRLKKRAGSLKKKKLWDLRNWMGELLFSCCLINYDERLFYFFSACVVCWLVGGQTGEQREDRCGPRRWTGSYRLGMKPLEPPRPEYVGDISSSTSSEKWSAINGKKKWISIILLSSFNSERRPEGMSLWGQPKILFSLNHSASMGPNKPSGTIVFLL